MNARTQAVKTITQVLLGSSLTSALKKNPSDTEHSLIQEISFGVLRYYFYLEKVLETLIQKPLKEKDTDVFAILLVGAYQILFMRIPDHAAVNETVKVAKDIKKLWAQKFINGVLRNLLRQKDRLLTGLHAETLAKDTHPHWLVQRLKTAWPTAWENSLLANDQRPPLTLRVNHKKMTSNDYLNLLTKHNISATQNKIPTAITLENAIPVENIPGFKDGLVSVQDSAAQLAAELLDLQPDALILDACAAPGGKTAHILEKAKVNLIALDIDPERTKKITENLQRLALAAKIITADANEPKTWWDGNLFDRILLDVPCSAIGVIRRHPDIKYLRRDEDISELNKLQLNLLSQIWPLLKSNGKLLYSTCSILPEENELVIQQFLAATKNAKEIDFTADWGHKKIFGRQILPGEDNRDGFYYCLLQKQ